MQNNADDEGEHICSQWSVICLPETVLIFRVCMADSESIIYMEQEITAAKPSWFRLQMPPLFIEIHATDQISSYAFTGSTNAC